jgi:1,2-diacylglycerol 3-beta-glucosyltransferase
MHRVPPLQEQVVGGAASQEDPGLDFVTVVHVLQTIILLPTGFFLGYLAILSVLAFVVRRRSFPLHRDQGRRFAIIVPAHNEEFTVGRTLESFLRLNYPRDLVTVVVVADNCSDNTEEAARRGGAEVLVRTDAEKRGKGYALRWAMDQLLERTPAFDALVVIDADSEADPEFLNAVDRALASGARVVQCSDMVRPQPGAWSSELTRVGFTLYNHARPLGRAAFGGSAGLRGNGMCFAASVLREHPWDAFSRAEDLEYGLRLLLDGVRVVFAPDARVYATMPVDSKNAETQRARWEGGRLPLIRRYAGPLVRRALLRGWIVHADALIDLVTPALVNMLALALSFAVVNAVLWFAGVWGAELFAGLWLVAAVLGIVHLFAGLAASGADRGQYAVLLSLPKFVLWKFALYLKLARGSRETSWIRTTREFPPFKEGHVQNPAHR